MANKKIALAYSIENIQVAETLDANFSKAGYAVQHIYGKKDDTAQSVNQRLRNQNAPILLLVSDNYLKSPKCMDEGLKLIHEKKDYILPVVIEGQVVGASEDEKKTIPTKFERVSDIIQYINYWQDQYLDLRRQKREINDLDEERFNEHLKVMRTISSEVGEFLRTLRTLDFVYYDDFKANGFEAFFEFMDDPEGWNTFKSSQPNTTEPTPIPSPEPEEEADQGEELDLSEIPGINLLPSEEEVPSIEEEAGEQPAETPQNEEEQKESEVNEEILESEAESDSDLESEVEEEQHDASEDLYVEEEEVVENEVETEEESSYGEEYDVNTAVLSAYELIEAGNDQAALAFIKNEIEEQPKVADLRYHYALMLVQKGNNPEDAQVQLEEAIDLAPDHTDALFLRADLALLKEDYASAFKYYKKVAEVDPEYTDIFYRMGSLLAKHFPDKSEKAGKYLKKSVRQNPSNIDAVYQYGVILNEQLKKPGKAKKFLKRVLELDKNHPFAYYDLALLFHQNGEPLMARQYYMKAIEVNPELQTEENDIAFGINTPEITAIEEQENVGLKENSANGSVVQNNYDTVETLEPPIVKTEVDEPDALELSPEISNEVVETSTEEEEQPALEYEAEEELPEKDNIRTILITGATAGIGRATAEIFAKNGYKVIITGRRQEKLNDLKEKLQEIYKANVHTLAFDVRDKEAVEQAITGLEGEWKNIDVLINNAGKAKGFDPIQEGKLHHWEEMIDTNLKGLLYLTRAVTPSMVERRTGHIINISSSAGKEVYPNGNVYCATKHAVEALTKGMRLDLHKHNIKVGQVSPGHVEETEFAEVRFDGDKERAKIYNDFLPLTARDVAATIYFIVSCPPHVNIQDVFMMGTQQASNIFIDRSGRENQ